MDAFTQPTQSTLGQRRAKSNPAFSEKLRQMALPLVPLVQLTSGQIHPSFPPTILHFWLLTSSELESLAAFYHQAAPCGWTHQYPCPIQWGADLTVEEKRRKIGRFIGLRGCETPTFKIKSDEEIIEEARKERRKDEDEMFRRKTSYYH